ncbi:iron-siderophore ABC transporter substrate-binding protein [Tumebacillus sp. ITR2]|uniref:Iron-siderophore ABC transporter substrate-binding protein n=1 Tax=Tumebacillus amylolyticus TaxID=2801339 RepID=A0ABS1J501_9BACL|nr:iron-siderophore ABC transporter substrate-binding protein [Tumebacillus amylolyticus]MBL0385352.1 iron-siderophore ABC transporter substrate-binding protein [Tumebacillus amylolyticus]
MTQGTYSPKKGLGFRFLAFLLAFCMIMVGCGSAAKDEASTDTTKPSGSTETTRTIKHAMGETTIKGDPKKVVILTNEGTEALLALGVKPVGAVKSWVGDPWYPHIASDMQGVTVVGDEGQPNLEAIAALQPDLIIGNKMRHEKIYEQLSAIAPTVFSTDLRGNWKVNFTLYAEALNKKAEGDKVLADYDKKVADLKAKAGDKLKNQISLVRFMPGKARIYYNNTFAGIIFKDLGLARPAKQNNDGFSDDVTKERIPDMEGDIMFYFTYETGNGQATKLEQEWTNDPLFKNLNVVKSGKAYKVDDTIWNTAGGVRAANLMLDDLAKYLLK